MGSSSKATTRTARLLLAAVQCLALASGVAAAKARPRQGDYLNRLRGSPSARQSWQAEASLAAVSTTPDRAPRHAVSSTPPAAVGHKESDRVDRLPGQPDGVDFAQYAGYVTVDASAGRALFYYLAEAVGNGSASRPLLLWLNGGPGCSSLGYGAMEELGPFRVMSDGKTLYRNPYSWNHAANVLFLESPAGVGFSYSNTTADYSRSGDNTTAEDALAFLLNWVERFPEYKGRDFYIAGESYAGHYVPQLAHAILRHAAGKASSPINFKGIMIGNAVINDWTDAKGMYDFFWTHALISDETADGISKNCNFTAGASDSNALCDDAQGEADESLRDIDIYNIYAPNCQSDGLVTPPITPSVENFDPCTDYYVEAYLNDPDVQKALHANVTRLDHPWSACSVVLRRWIDSATTVLPIIQELLKNNIRVWVYSGDIDGRVPVTSTRYSVNQLQLPVATKWRPWFSSTQGAGEVGGYVVKYKGNLSLVTVRGAGHEVPSYQPLRALVLVQNFLAGKMLPDCKKCEQV
ncbi:serine carboxypeptidase II-3-like [Phragmites australis]|uniref:serine carboxypeptidase II-3-like n=1 Tax=Phragmites australis TaxID=29695 RepID=UPI002D794BC7|nr:serine carboxypeptidase II-3-like [Phragmites australis]